MLLRISSESEHRAYLTDRGTHCLIICLLFAALAPMLAAIEATWAAMLGANPTAKAPTLITSNTGDA